MDKAVEKSNSRCSEEHGVASQPSTNLTEQFNYILRDKWKCRSGCDPGIRQINGLAEREQLHFIMEREAGRFLTQKKN